MNKTGFTLHLGVLPLVFCLMLLAYGCQSDEPLRLGFIAGTSGRVADLGISGRDAVQMAVEEVNREGGIHGRPVELVIRDDKQDPDMAKKGVEELIDTGVAAIIGPMTSAMAVAVKPLFDRARILAVSPTVTSQALSNQDDYFFRVTSTTLAYASKSAAYHVRTRDMMHITALYDLGNRVFCENWLANFNALFTANGGEVLGALGFDAGRSGSFLDLARKALALSPDGILIVANSMDSALLCQQIRKLDVRIPITLADWGATERLLELGGRAVAGVTVVQNFDRNHPGRAYQNFRHRYLDRYKREPGFPGVYAYEAVRVVLTALGRQKKGQSLKDVLLSVRSFKGLQNDIRFDDFGDVNRANGSISIVRNNQFVVLE